MFSIFPKYFRTFSVCDNMLKLSSNPGQSNTHTFPLLKIIYNYVVQRIFEVFNLILNNVFSNVDFPTDVRPIKTTDFPGSK